MVIHKIKTIGLRVLKKLRFSDWRCQ